MTNFLAKRYYTIVSVFVLYIILNIVFKNKLIYYIFHIFKNESITDANAYANATCVENLLGGVTLTSFALISIISIVLLYAKAGGHLNKVILISVPIIFIVSLFIAMVEGAFR